MEPRKLVRTADTRMGDGPYTYANYYLADTTVNSRRMLADVLAATADSLENRYKKSSTGSDRKSCATPASSPHAPYYGACRRTAMPGPPVIAPPTATRPPPGSITAAPPHASALQNVSRRIAFY